MGTGSQAVPGFDLSLTELAGDGTHRFLIDIGSPASADMLDGVPIVPADERTVGGACPAVAEAAGQMSRSMQSRRRRGHLSPRLFRTG